MPGQVTKTPLNQSETDDEIFSLIGFCILTTDLHFFDRCLQQFNDKGWRLNFFLSDLHNLCELNRQKDFTFILTHKEIQRSENLKYIFMSPFLSAAGDNFTLHLLN